MKTNDIPVLRLTFESSNVGVNNPIIQHVSRGVILSGVLQGTAGYDSVPVMTDTPVSDSEPDIDYNPETDQRLDRFDAVEMGIEAIDEDTPTRLPSGTVESKAEKKE